MTATSPIQKLFKVHALEWCNALQTEVIDSELIVRLYIIVICNILHSVHKFAQTTLAASSGQRPCTLWDQISGSATTYQEFVPRQGCCA
jgi:hypothetical protein